jgi:hypothetical protein
MRNLQINSRSEQATLLAREELLGSIKQDLQGMAEMFARVRMLDGYLSRDQYHGVVRAQATIERGVQLTDRLLSTHE